MSVFQRQMCFIMNNRFILEYEIFSGFDGLFIIDPTSFEYEGNKYWFPTDGHASHFILYL